MSLITLDSGSTVEVADKAVATLINDSTTRLQGKVTEQQGTIGTQKTCIDALNDEVTKLKEQTSDAALSARVKAIADARIDAAKIAGKDFACDSVDVVEIQRAALTALDGEKDWSDKSPAYIEGQFDAAVAAADQRKQYEDEDEDEEDTKDVGGRGRERQRSTGDAAPSYRQLAQDGAGETQTQDAPKSSYDSYKQDLGNAWKVAQQGSK